MTTAERLYHHARKDLGMSEAPGSKSHPRIELAIQTAARWLDDDDSQTAWCGCLMGLWCLELGLGVPAAYYRAISWLKWGLGVEKPDAEQGDVVVLSRPGGNHVALLDRIEGKRWHLLGGNQSNTTSVAPYAEDLVLGVRRAA
ncbi:MAG TPA: TIGR02594 family protein [Candidatus Saccharimonadia bacterium]|nr:TIGR02594 family protein [Candidatus Saccharimonadia bacterium]